MIAASLFDYKSRSWLLQNMPVPKITLRVRGWKVSPSAKRDSSSRPTKRWLVLNTRRCLRTNRNGNPQCTAAESTSVGPSKHSKTGSQGTSSPWSDPNMVLIYQQASRGSHLPLFDCNVFRCLKEGSLINSGGPWWSSYVLSVLGWVPEMPGSYVRTETKSESITQFRGNELHTENALLRIV